MINVIANIPITQATSVMLIDYCGGRTSRLYSVMNRRMWIMLAAMRALTTAWSSWATPTGNGATLKGAVAKQCLGIFGFEGLPRKAQKE